MALAPRGLLDDYQEAGTARVVPIGAAGFVTFQQMPVIGTYNMNGGSVAMIVSQDSAILAHIPPQQAATTSPYAGDANARQTMALVKLYYDHYRPFYNPGAAHVVCAWYNGAVGLESQIGIIIDSFCEMGLVMTEVHHYNVPVDQTAPGQGTALVDSGRVYVQDRLVAELEALPMTPSTAEETSEDEAGLELGSGTRGDDPRNGDHVGAVGEGGC